MTLRASAGRERLSPMDSTGRRLPAFATTIVASLATAVALTAASGRGGDDVGAFTFWTLPFAAVIAVAIPRFAASLHRRQRRITIAVVVGGLAGLLWTLAVAALLGPFALAFGFPVAIAWAAGGGAGLVAGAALESPGGLRLVRRSSYGALMLAVAATLVLSAAAILFEPEPDVRVELRGDTSDAEARAFVEDVVMSQPGVESVTRNDPHVLEIELSDAASEEELAQLRASLTRSRFVVGVEVARD